jgi:hypothetical protein
MGTTASTITHAAFMTPDDRLDEMARYYGMTRCVNCCRGWRGSTPRRRTATGRALRKPSTSGRIIGFAERRPGSAEDLIPGAAFAMTGEFTVSLHRIAAETGLVKSLFSYVISIWWAHKDSNLGRAD